MDFYISNHISIMEKYIFIVFNNDFILFYIIQWFYIDGDLKHFALVSVLIGEIMELSSAVTLIIANVYCSGRSRLPPIDFNYCNIQFIIDFSNNISFIFYFLAYLELIAASCLLLFAILFLFSFGAIFYCNNIIILDTK